VFRISVVSIYVDFDAQRVTSHGLFYIMTSTFSLAAQIEFVDG